MAKQLWLNNYDTELTGVVRALPETGTPATELGYGIIQLPGSAASVLPALTGGDWLLLTLYTLVSGLEANIEIVKVTSIDATSGSETRLTVERGYEGTTLRAYAVGDKVSLRMTAGTARNFAQKSMNLADLPDLGAARTNLGVEPAIAAPGSTPTDKYWRGDKTWRDFFTDVRAATLTGLSTATSAVIAAADTVLGALGKLQAQITGHTGASSGAHAATAISNTPAGNIAATTVQAAINELDSEKFNKTGGSVGGGTDRGLVTFASAFGDGGSAANIALSAPATAQGQKAGVAFYPTFTGTVDNGPRRAADIWSSFNGAWGAERLSFGVGRGNSSANDAQLVTLETLALTSAGEVLAVRGALGYGAGAGGTVTQSTSKTTDVTINKVNGQITTSNSSMTAGQVVAFKVLNSTVNAASHIVVTPSNAGSIDWTNYNVWLVYNTAADNEFIVVIRNISASTLSQSLVINFAVFSGSQS